MRTFTGITALISLLIFSLQSFSITRVSACSGNWTSPATWNPSGAPACGDSVVIQAAHTVSLSTQVNYSGCVAPIKLIIDGKLHFVHGSKLQLSCGSYIIVHAGGRIEADVGFSNSNYIEICGNVEWNSNAALDGPACIPPSHPMCQGVLPIELINFSAFSCNNNICLNWQTATETNNHYFEIQRSNDGIYYVSILKLNSKAVYGNSTYRINYECSDNNPAGGTTYYRLKQVNLDGSYSYCKTIAFSTDWEKNNEPVIYPNINSGEFSAHLNILDNPGTVAIILRNSSGEIVYKNWQYVADPSEPIHVSPPNKLPNGIYYCSFLAGTDEYKTKLVINQ